MAAAATAGTSAHGDGGEGGRDGPWERLGRVAAEEEAGASDPRWQGRRQQRRKHGWVRTAAWSAEEEAEVSGWASAAWAVEEEQRRRRVEE
jgi:hypothetical protein